MTKTRTDVINNAALALKARSRGFDLKDYDFELIGDVYDGMHERLRISNKIYWSSSNCVPIEAYEPISAILAGEVISSGKEYGLDDTTQAKIQMRHDKGFIEINEVKSAGKVPSGEPVVANYF